MSSLLNNRTSVLSALEAWSSDVDLGLIALTFKATEVVAMTGCNDTLVFG